MDCCGFRFVFVSLFSWILLGSRVNPCQFPEFYLITHGGQLITYGQPKTVSCQIVNLSCPTLSATGCNLDINWFVRVKSDDYSSHSLLHDKYTEDVVQSLSDSYNITTYKSDLPCGYNINATFSVNFTDIGPYEEVLVSCGLTMSESHAIDNKVAVLRQYTPNVFSKQINGSPSIIVAEGDQAMITCEAPPSSQSVSLHPQWMLDGSMISDTPFLINTSKSVPLKTGMELNILTIDGPIYNDTTFGEVRNFSIKLVNVRADITGLRVYCALWWEERNVTKCYEQAAVVAVVPQDKFVVSTDQSRVINSKEGDNVTISCTRIKWTQAEWEFLFPNNTHLFYSQNMSTLQSIGLDFQDSSSESSTEKYHQFNVTLIVQKTMNGMKIRCTVREGKERNESVNFIENVVIVDKAPGTSASSIATVATAASLTSFMIPTAIAIVIIIVIIYFIHRCKTSKITPIPSKEQKLSKKK